MLRVQYIINMNEKLSLFGDVSFLLLCLKAVRECEISKTINDPSNDKICPRGEIS